VSAPLEKNVWFITGSSSGFGLCLTEELLAQGYRVSATLRKPEVLEPLVAKFPDTLITPKVDVTQPEQTRSAVAATIEKWGRIDVLANNAGYGQGGMIEDTPIDQVREVFETNVFGALETIRAVLPTMREQKSGVILNLSSVVGLVSYRGGGFYAATKHALEAMSESLAVEVAPWGIKVIAIEPGPFRTDFAGRSFVWATSRMPEYDALYETTFGIYERMNGTQAGDPVRAVKLMIEVSESTEPPLRLPMGKFALEEVELLIESLTTDKENWRQKILDTDFPA
jgi:NAD(P)-dependent dehydrogenase (short-subunit alcohol dehydrogenase family)